MQLNSFYFLVNPLSGGHQGRKLINAIANLIHANSINGEIHQINFNNIEEQIQASQAHDALIIAGGDGTISYILSKLVDSNIPVGIMPLGTGNDLARELNIYPYFSITEPIKIINLFKKAEIKQITIWKLEYQGGFRTFVNYLSFGFDAEVVNSFTNIRNCKYYFLNKFGKYGNRVLYVIASLQHLVKSLKLEGATIKDDNNKTIDLSLQAKTLLFANIKSIIGIGKSNLISDFSDHRIELITVNTFLNYIGIICNLFIFAPKVIGSSESWTIKNLQHNSKIQIDGEAVSDISSTEYVIRKSHQVPVFSLS